MAQTPSSGVMAQGPGPVGGFGSSGYSKGSGWGDAGGKPPVAKPSAKPSAKQPPKAAPKAAPPKGGAPKKPEKRSNGDAAGAVVLQASLTGVAASASAGAAEPDSTQAAADNPAPKAAVAPAAPRFASRAPLPPERPIEGFGELASDAVAAAPVAANATAALPTQAAVAQAEPQAEVAQRADPAMRADPRLAALAPTPPERPKEVDAAQMAALAPQQASAPPQQSAEPAEAPQEVVQQAAQQPAGGFNIFKFLSGKSQTQTATAEDMPAANPHPAHGRRHARGAARDAAARARIAPLIERHARANGIPVSLADAVIRVESRYNPAARNGPYLGLSQIHLNTARSVGYSGAATGLMDADTNLRYGMRYLAGAYRLAGGDTCRTILKYQAGHRAERMTSHASRYCSRVRTMMASH